MDNTKSIQEQLARIQKSLKVSKNQLNSFGGYKYRSCEDILEAVKPLLKGLTLTISDEVVNIGDRYYVKATALLVDKKDHFISCSAYAREAETKKGMDEAQITGATSSYARKYALNGLFAIDDTKDADTMDNRETKPAKTTPKSTTPQKDPTEDWPSSKPEEKPVEPIAPKTDICPRCKKAKMILNPKTGKYFCEDKCWLNL